MEEIKKTVSYTKSGSGSFTPRVIMPTNWLKDMGIDKENNKVLPKYNKNTKEIIIKKLTE